MRAAIYVRLSQHRGTSDPSTSPERQREACQAYAAAQGWEVVDVFEDLDVSGGESGLRLDRPGIRRIRDRFADLDVVIFLKLDRLARSVADFSTFAAEAASSEVALVSVRDGLDLSTPGGRFVAQILAAFAEMELATITERIRDGKRKAKELGRWQGGGLPFGLRVENGFLTIDEAEASALTTAADALMEGGGSLRRATAALADSGYRPRRSATWTRKTTKRLLTNDYAPSILGAERAQLVAEALAAHTRPTTTNPKRLLSGLLRCHSCGGMAYVNKRGRDDSQDVYRCVARANGRPCETPVGVTAPAIDAWAEATYLDAYGDQAETVAVRLADERVARIASLTRRIEACSEALPALPRDERRAALADLENLESELDDLRSSPSYGITALRTTGRTYREAWEAGSLDDRRDLLRTALTTSGGHLTLLPGRRGVRGFDPARIAESAALTG